MVLFIAVVEHPLSSILSQNGSVSIVSFYRPTAHPKDLPNEFWELILLLHSSSDNIEKSTSIRHLAQERFELSNFNKVTG